MYKWLFVFFFKQKTAYEMRISDWSSDVCSSDLFVDNVEGGLVDIIIGTQLVTKGYHFPNLTLVGVVDADLGLDGGDLRASERTFQQIAQVAGRAGRGVQPGEALRSEENTSALQPLMRT